MEKKYKSFSLPGGGVFRIHADKIIATVSSFNKEGIDIYCADTALPFHIAATKHTPQEIMDYVWDNHENEEGI